MFRHYNTIAILAIDCPTRDEKVISMITIDNPAAWLLLPPGNKALLRFPADTIPHDAVQAGFLDVFAANLGRYFPWGNVPDETKASRMWQEKTIGYGGLYHKKWFVTREGRVGGADNVPKQLPGVLRKSMFYDGGSPMDGELGENEGYAVVKDVDQRNMDFYRRVQLHAAEHVGADGGAIILSPLFEGNKAYVGFVGRCQLCPNPELISFRQLQSALNASYDIMLYPEWKNWTLTTPQKEAA
jgi:hypothetical protein